MVSHAFTVGESAASFLEPTPLFSFFSLSLSLSLSLPLSLSLSLTHTCAHASAASLSARSSRLASCVTLTKELDGLTAIVPDNNPDLSNYEGCI